MNGEKDSSPVRGTPVIGVTDVRQSEPYSSQSEPHNRLARRGRRATRLKELALSWTAGKKLEIQFDENLAPFGYNKNTYISYVGTLACNKPSILIDEWKNVYQANVKDLIWDYIWLTYKASNSQKLKYKTLSYCANCWRKFKTQLANNYIFAEVPVGEAPPNPCDKYTFLDEQTWQ